MTSTNQPKIIKLTAPPADLDDPTMALIRARFEAAYARSPDRFPGPAPVFEFYVPRKRLARKVAEHALLGLVVGLTAAAVFVGGATLLAYLL